ncbi:MAG TPA: DNA-directed RNA polymerase subunit alpha [Actinomycetota bacterium]|nr:DNA-directed RNA polymerase subunit alpha [Actinomycetota bacterium]
MRATVSEEQVNDRMSKFIVEPLEPGFGYTVGNAMRRTLLSSVPGAAIALVKIEGVLHEFTTIPGIKEDVTELVLNIKDIVVRMESDESSGTLQLRARGPKEVKASDIETPAGITIVNPDVHVASLNAKGRLDMELTVERGIGYDVADRMKGKDVIGVIPIDAIFSPVRRVTYVVEHTRVEQMTNYDRLVLEVETNGAVSPSEAVMHAARRLGELMGLFRELVEGPLPVEEPAVESAPAYANEPIEKLELTVRTLNSLKRVGVHHVGDLLEYSIEDLMDIRNFGEKSVDEVKEKIESMGLSLKVKEG